MIRNFRLASLDYGRTNAALAAAQKRSSLLLGFEAVPPLCKSGAAQRRPASSFSIFPYSFTTFCGSPRRKASKFSNTIWARSAMDSSEAKATCGVTRVLGV